MTDQDKISIEGFKEDVFKMLNDAIANVGGLPPCIAILFKDEENNYQAMLSGVPDDFIKNDKSKNDFVKKEIPRIFFKLVNNNKYPICFMFASEAYVSVLSTNNQDVNPEDLINNLKNESFVTEDTLKNILNNDNLDIVKEECVIFSFETIKSSELIVKKIKRSGKTVNEKGDVIDAIEFESFDLGNEEKNIKNASGKFTDVLKNFYKELANIS